MTRYKVQNKQTEIFTHIFDTWEEAEEIIFQSEDPCCFLLVVSDYPEEPYEPKMLDGEWVFYQDNSNTREVWNGQV